MRYNLYGSLEKKSLNTVIKMTGCTLATGHFRITYTSKIKKLFWQIFRQVQILPRLRPCYRISLQIPSRRLL